MSEEMGDRCNENEVDDTSSDEGACDENKIDDTKKIEEPKVGMVFSSQDDGYHYYTSYARKEGFGVQKRSSRCGDDGTMRYFTLACARARKAQSAKNPLKPNLTTKTNCPAKLCLTLQPDGKFKLTTLVLDHNHTLSPGKIQFKCNKQLDRHEKRRLELNDQARIRINKNFNSLVVEGEGNENLPFGEKECQNYIEKIGRLRLGVGDIKAIHNYFVRMQANNSNFFYVMDLDEDCRLRNLFWADARARATYEAFGDVVTFDTTYLTNKYNMPFATFVGVNHHGQLVLLGCCLLSNDDTETFVWLFESWLACMSWCPPKAIITDQCKAMQKAIEKVFPNTRHWWCVWHIMKQIPDKLRGYSQFEGIETALQNIVYDSFTKDEFEEGWRGMLEKYHLYDNEWLGGLYDERHRWVPIYVRDTFWAGMSTTGHSESMNSFFDGHVNSKTSLKQFFEQYNNVLRSKVEKEDQADYHSFNSRYECISNFRIEIQFQEAYTNAKFKEFQNELMIGKLYCYPNFVKVEGSICIYQVTEDVKIGNRRKDVIFSVYFSEVECEVKCTCQLFEFKGIMCRHSLSVLTQRRVLEVPPTYIISRWKKDINRKYIYIRSNYDNSSVKPHAERYNKMIKEMEEVAMLATELEENCDTVMSNICELKNQLLSKEPTCGSNQPNQATSPTKRKVSKVKEFVKRKDKQHCKKGSEDQGIKNGGSDQSPPTENTPRIVNEIGTQEKRNVMVNQAIIFESSYVDASSTSNQAQGVGNAFQGNIYQQP